MRRTGSWSMVLLLAVSMAFRINVTGSKRVNHAALNLQRSEGRSPKKASKLVPTSMIETKASNPVVALFQEKADGLLRSFLESIPEDASPKDRVPEAIKDNARETVENYKRLIPMFASDSGAKITFLPSSHSTTIPAHTHKVGHLNTKITDHTYFEVLLVIEYAGEICPGQVMAEGQSTAAAKVTLWLGYRHFEMFKQLFEAMFPLTDIAGLGDAITEAREELGYLQHHLKFFPPDVRKWSVELDERASHFDRMMKLIFRASKEVQRHILSLPFMTSFLEAPLQKRFANSHFSGEAVLCEPLPWPGTLPTMFGPGLPLPWDGSTLGSQRQLKIKYYNANEHTSAKWANEYSMLLEKLEGDPETDILVTCQTEATKSFHGVLEGKPGWKLVAHGAHWGKTAIAENNAQILNVFLKQEVVDETPQFEHYPRNWRVPRDWPGTMKWAHPKRTWAYMVSDRNSLLAATDIVLSDGTLLLAVRTRLHETTGSGKGGASTILSIFSGAGRERTKVAFACVHGDSESHEERENGMKQIATEIEGEVVAGTRPLDSTFFLGDLNYRPWYVPAQHPIVASGWPSEMARLICTDEGRATFVEYDPLRVPSGEELQANATRFSVVTRPAEGPRAQRGLGMTCNSPFSRYIPTYKRRNKNGACEQLHAELEKCSSFNRHECKMKCGYDTYEKDVDCIECFTRGKFCDSLILNCYSSVKETEASEFKVTKGNPIGFEAIEMQDPVTKQFKLTVWHVVKDSSAYFAGVRIGYDIVQLTETNVKTLGKKGKAAWGRPLKLKGAKVQQKDIRSGLGWLTTFQTLGPDKDSILKGAAVDDWQMLIKFSAPAEEWGLKQDMFLQMGWLDRLCWKSTEPAEIELLEDTAMTMSTSSDHMPTDFVARLDRWPAE